MNTIASEITCSLHQAAFLLGVDMNEICALIHTRQLHPIRRHFKKRSNVHVPLAEVDAIRQQQPVAPTK